MKKLKNTTRLKDLEMTRSELAEGANGLSGRAWRCLYNQGIETIAQLKEVRGEDLMQGRGFGVKRLIEVRNFLIRNNISAKLLSPVKGVREDRKRCHACGGVLRTSKSE